MVNVIKVLRAEETTLENRLGRVKSAIAALSAPMVRVGVVVRRKRKLSAAGRLAISKAAKARWAKRKTVKS